MKKLKDKLNELGVWLLGLVGIKHVYVSDDTIKMNALEMVAASLRHEIRLRDILIKELKEQISRLERDGDTALLDTMKSLFDEMSSSQKKRTIAFIKANR
jgi:hypothetical protein